MLGRGEFGEVHSGIYRGTQVAVKSIHESKQSDAAVANFLREASFMTLVCVCVCVCAAYMSECVHTLIKRS